MPLLDETMRQELKAMRAHRDEAVHARAQKVAERIKVARELETLQRQFGLDDDRTQAAAARYRAVVNDLKAARDAEHEARIELHGRLKQRLPANPEDDVAALSGTVPIVLLPIRMETRFARRPFDRDAEAFAGVLKVRIYPDGIVGNSHEPRLTENERDAGFDYWRNAWADADEVGAWAALIEEIPGPRAAWVVKQTEPTNRAADFPEKPGADAPEPVFPDVETRPPNWQRLPSAEVLPDRWVIIGYRNFVEVRRAHSLPVEEPLALTMTFSSDGEEPELNDLVELSNGLEVDREILWTFDFGRALEVGMAVELPLTVEDLEQGFQQLLVLGVKSSLDPRESAERLGELVDAHHYSRGFAFVPQGAPTNNVNEVPSSFPPPDPRGEASFRVERGAALVDPKIETDGVRFMRALGLSVDHAAHIFGADRDEQRTARAMADALWPCTLGYFLEHMMRPVVGDDALARPDGLSHL